MNTLRAIGPAVAAAMLFGASTPLAKYLVADVSPLLLAGLLYLGSGLGLLAMLVLRVLYRRESSSQIRIQRQDLGWLAAAIVAGGVMGPALLMWGLARTGGAASALLLNMEGVFTAALAWLVFKESADRGIVFGMVAIVAGGILLAWNPGGTTWSAGAAFVMAACLAWAVDNNLTRKVSSNDAMLVACIKGLVAGACNTCLGFASGAAVPGATSVLAAMVLGLLGYGLSLTLFVVSLRTLGAARTGAYFSTAPVVGVLVALSIWPSPPSILFWCALLLMGLGVWLHVRERHTHEHTHEVSEHAHHHRHDEHHRHEHGFDWDASKSHAHAHRHEALTHKHPHYPDIHHRHGHVH